MFGDGGQNLPLFTVWFIPMSQHSLAIEYTRYQLITLNNNLQSIFDCLLCLIDTESVGRWIAGELTPSYHKLMLLPSTLTDREYRAPTVAVTKHLVGEPKPVISIRLL